MPAGGAAQLPARLPALSSHVPPRRLHKSDIKSVTRLPSVTTRQVAGARSDLAAARRKLAPTGQEPGPARPGRRRRDMSTMEQARPADVAPDAADLGAAAEEQMAKIVTELGAALGVLLTSLGTRSGLWAALAGAGPLTTAQVAAKVSVEPSLVREWLRAQAAGGYLDYEPATGMFTLPDAVARVALPGRRHRGRRGYGRRRASRGAA